MAMRKFKPLDLSFIAAAGSPERESFRNVAAMINANAGWVSPEDISAAFEKQAKADKAAMSKHKPTFLSGLFDLLSAPLYGVGNALDESIAGHQSDNNDSVLQDALQTAGGVFTGAVKGIGAGLRGSTSMLDGLPGVNISDEWQMDPTDKTRFGDVNVRLTAKMSTKDASNPENWAEAAANIQKEKDEVPPWLQDIFYTDLNSENAQEEFLRKMRIIGIAEDIGGDPLNFVSFGGKGVVNAGKAAVAGLDEARNARGADDVLAGLMVGSGKKLKDGNKFTTPPIPSGPRTVAEIAPAKGFEVPVPKPTSILPETMPVVSKGKVKGLSSVGARANVPKAGLEVSRSAQASLAKEIAKMAAGGKPGWVYQAADLLRKYKGVDFTNTERFIDLADKMVKVKGGRHNPEAMVSTLSTRIAQDVEAARKVISSERIINTKRADEIIEAPVKSKLRPHHAKIANAVIAKFSKEILGKAQPSGTGDLLTNAIARKQNARWSGPQQARMWNEIGTALKGFNGPAKFEVMAKILQHVEDHFLSMGAVPYSGAKLKDSVEGLRLSQIAMAVGPRAMAENPHLVTRILAGDAKALESLTNEQRQAIETLKASESMASAPAAAKGIQAGKDFASEVLAKVQSAGRTKAELNGAGKVAEKATVSLGGGPVAAKVAKQYVTRLVNNPTGLDAVLSANKLKTEVWIAAAKKGMPKNDPAFLKSVMNAIYAHADLPTPATLGKLAGSAAKVRDSFGALFNAAYGVKDMNPILRRHQASALSTAAQRAKFINEIAKVFPPKDVDLWHEAMRGAQADSISEGRVAELQSEISKVVESLFGGTGLRAGALYDSTVVGRNRLAMNELNAQLKRFGLAKYQFTAGKKVKDALGNTRDFSKGADWLKSWEMWDIAKPYDFLHRVQQAVEATVRRKMMTDEIAARFGSTVKHGDVKYAIDHPRLGGFFFNEEAARQGQQFLKILKELDTPNSKMLQHLDHVISKIKASLTIYIPSHHWTNIIGDVSFNWFAGVNNPVRYTQAAKVLSSQKNRYGDIIEWQNNVVGPEALTKAIIRGKVGTEALLEAGLKVHPTGNAVILTMQNGEKVTADMIYAAMMREGILPTARVLEEITSDVTSILDKIRPLGGKGQKAAHVISEVRDHIPRAAQFIDGLAKSKGTFHQAVESSAATVRKWHPDGLDITSFERNFMKRVFPFYSWTRKAIPLAVEAALTASSKVMAYPRLMEELAAINGVEGENGSAGGAFPNDQMFPDWLRERGIGPIAGGPGSYLFVNPSTPVLDIGSMVGHPGQAAIDMINPMAKIPLELAQGSTLGKQVPIENDADYLARQIPGLSQAGRISGYYGTSKSVANSDEQKFLNLINLLTGAKATQSGIYQKSAQFDLRDYFAQRAKENR